MEVKKLLEASLIYLVGELKWVSLMVVTPKKNGKWHICVDYKQLNVVTKSKNFTLPFYDEVLDEIKG